ncbi:hypothetical protein [Terrabacter sp. NPDC000476]|uniref:hypothetical protein n=1 Tax=Terrabacter sp. NPDC000476 TaxID=3154258 RepID=UPI003333AD2E
MTPEEERSADLLDVELADEIELVSDLVVAASSSPRHFTPDEVDELLGIGGEPVGPAVGNATEAPADAGPDAGPDAASGTPAASASVVDPAS